MGSTVCCAATKPEKFQKKQEQSMTGNRQGINVQVSKQSNMQPPQANILQLPMINQNPAPLIIPIRVGPSLGVLPNEPRTNEPQNQSDAQDSDDLSDRDMELSSEENLSPDNLRDLIQNRAELGGRLREIMDLLMIREAGGHELIDVFDPKSIEHMQKMNLPEDGLMPHETDTVISYKYEKKKKDAPPEECNICLVDFENGDTVKRLQCLHLYHAKCMDEWLAKKSVCPDCKFNLRSLNLDQFI